MTSSQPTAQPTEERPERAPRPIHHVVVAVDGGEASGRALDWALDRVQGIEHAEVELVTVVPEGVAVAPGVAEQAHPAAERVLREARIVVEQRAPHLPVATTVLEGRRAHELVRATENADLAVIGTNKTSVVGAELFGTLPLRLAAGAACPVVVVPRSWTATGGPVVVGVPGDDTAEIALAYAAHEAERLGRRLEIVHGWTIPSFGYGEAFVDGETVTVVEDAERERLEAAVQEVRSRHPQLEVSPQLVEGVPVGVLVGAAEGADLLVLGRHNRNAFTRFVLGSVTHGVLLTPPCPVLVVPAE